MRRRRRELRTGTLRNKPGLSPVFQLREMPAILPITKWPASTFGEVPLTLNYSRPRAFPGAARPSSREEPAPPGEARGGSAGFIPSQAGTAPRLPRPGGRSVVCRAGLGEAQGSGKSRAGGTCVYIYISPSISQRQKMTVHPAARVGIPRLSSSAVCVLLRSCEPLFSVSFLQASLSGAKHGPAELGLGGPRRSASGVDGFAAEPRSRYGGAGVWQRSPLRPTCSSAPFLRPRRTYRASEEVFDHLLPTEAFVFHFANAPL